MAKDPMIISKEKLENASKKSPTIKMAARRIGISPSQFSRLCRESEVELPGDRKRREREEHVGRRSNRSGRIRQHPFQRDVD